MFKYITILVTPILLVSIFVNVYLSEVSHNNARALADIKQEIEMCIDNIKGEAPTMDICDLAPMLEQCPCSRLGIPVK